MVTLNRLDRRYFSIVKNMQLDVKHEHGPAPSFGIILKIMRQIGWHMTDVDYMGPDPGQGNTCVTMGIHSDNKSTARQEVINPLRSRAGVLFAKEI